MTSSTIQKIKIKHAGNVIIDTVPPTGTVLINNGRGYAKNKKVSIALNASDNTTGIKNMEVRNVDINVASDGSETESSHDFIPLPYEENIFWNLNDLEGFKKVEVKFRDYANNISSFSSNSSVKKFFSIGSEEIEGIVRIGDDVFSSTIDEGKIYITRHYPKLIADFDNETIVSIIDNNNVLYVSTNLTSTSKVYYYLDGEFVSLNTFNSLIVDIASYDGEIYTALEDGKLYKKDSSAWLLITTFTRDVLNIDGEGDYLYVMFNDSVDSIQIYNGTTFQTVDTVDLFAETEAEESSSSSESSSSPSSTEAKSSSSQTLSTSSSSLMSQSTSSITVSESSSSTNVKSSSSSSESSSSSSTLEESSGISSPSSESISSDSFLRQFSSSSSSSDLNSSSTSSSDSEVSQVTSSSESSISSGDICNCGKFIDNSLYINDIHFSNLKDVNTYQCNLFGRLVGLGSGWLRVLFYKDLERTTESEIARSDDFYYSQIDKSVNIVESNGSGVSGHFTYSSLYDGTVPNNFVILCEGKNTSSESSISSGSSSTERTSSESQDVMIGSGTATDPFLVKTSGNLMYVIANPTSYYRLYNNIDMSLADSSSVDIHFPIGSSSVPFEGHFNGDGHIIYNLSLNKPTVDNVGLFGYTSSATIIKLGLHSANIIGKNSVGALVGRAINSNIEQCYVYNGTITGQQSVGGLIGYLDSQSDILNSYSRNSSLIGTSTVGGLVGFRRSSSSIVYCYSASPNSSVATFKGGLIGGVSADAFVFSILSPQTHVTFESQTVDLDDDEGEVISSYWDVDYTGLASSEGGTGKSTADMNSETTFIGWDFAIIWNIQSEVNDRYPYLRVFPVIPTENSSSSSTEVQELSSSSSSESSRRFTSSTSSSSIYAYVPVVMMEDIILEWED